MKRSEMLKSIEWLLINKLRIRYAHHVWSEADAEKLLEGIEQLGMLPPVQSCKPIPDDRVGGLKHSESKREWDEE